MASTRLLKPFAYFSLRNQHADPAHHRRTDPLPHVLSTAWHAFWEVTR